MPFQINKTGVLIVWCLWALILLGCFPAYAADCSNPAGNEGQLKYNGDENVLQYCDGTAWIAMGTALEGGGGGGSENSENGIYISKISSRYEANCALKSDGSVVCWGQDSNNQVTNTPADTDFTHVAAGLRAHCGLKSDGSIKCWGGDSYGEVSNVPSGNDFVQMSAAFAMCAVRSDNTLACWGHNVFNSVASAPTSSDIAQVSMGNWWGCALKTDGSITCWGNGATSPPAGTDFKQVSAGHEHACALKNDGSLVCWGYDVHGQVSDTPGGNDFTQVDAGYRHSCALKSDSSVVCWGLDSSGAAVSNAPTGNDFVEVTSGEASCALKTDGSLFCWGDNNSNQVSDTPSPYGFAQPPGGSGPPDHVEIISAYWSASTCALRSNGMIDCWGDNAGNREVYGNYTQVAHGDDFTCGLTTDGSITCWGDNGDGQSTPPAGNDFIQVSAGWWHACALRNNGTLTCWGQDSNNQVTDTPAGTDFTSVTSGRYHSCALKTDDTIVCWGDDYDEVPAGSGYVQVSAGDGHNCGLKSDGSIVCIGYDGQGQATPPSGTDFVQIDSGNNHNCAVKTDGSLVCWGDDGAGESTPPAGNNFAQVTAGHQHSCAIKADGTVECWGSDSAGQFSDLPATLLVGFAGSGTQTGCASPEGVAGDIYYNGDYHVMQYCNGSTWVAMGPPGDGGAGCSYPYGPPGDIVYNSPYKVVQYCEGDEWIAVGKKIVPDYAPDAFAFTDQTDVAVSTQIESNIIQITGISYGTAISITGDGSPEYRICADATCSGAPAYTSSAGTIDAGDYVQLRLTSNASNSTMNSATLTIGTESDQWDVTTEAAGPTGCPSVGDVCSDGSIFAGDTNMYVTDTNQSTSSKWQISLGTDDINPDSLTDGQANHDNRSGTLADFPAFEICENLDRHGHQDWYLPARDELDTLYTNKSMIGGFTTSYYWSSSEHSVNVAWYQNLSNGDQDNGSKGLSLDVRCIRRQ